ncbi:MAG: flagellar filament capping protein FliD [Defluviitaleaceae bacterium]|nr:flagellar filament capping protein FliD [Defluviitaleaceae bacterium]
MTGTPIRFTGLFSGMDTQSMVNQLMRAESMRMDRLNRRRQTLAWRREDLRSTMTTLNTFRNERTDHIGRNSINNPSNWNPRATATQTNAGATINGGNGNNGVVGAGSISVTATSNARLGSFDIKVRQTAQGDLVRGAQFRISETSPLFPPLESGAPNPHGRPVNLNSQMLSFLAISGTGDPTLGSNHYEYVRIGNANIRLNASDTVQEFMNRVNASNLAGVNMGFDATRGIFTLEARGVGANAIVTTGNDDLGFLEHIGLANIRPGAPGAGVGGTITGAPPAGTMFAGSSISDVFAARGLALPPSVDMGDFGGVPGQIINITAATTFQDIINAINNPNSGTDFTISFSNGRFTATGRDISSSIVTGSNAILDFMGLNNLNEAPPSPSVITDTVHSSLAGISNYSDLNDFLTNSALAGSTIASLLPNTANVDFPVTITIGDPDNGGATIVIDDTTTLGAFINNMQTAGAAAGISFDFDATNYRLVISATAPGQEIPLIGAEDADGWAVLDLFGISSQTIMQIQQANAQLVSYVGSPATPTLDAYIAPFLGIAAGADNQYVSINDINIEIRHNDTFHSFMHRVNTTPNVGVQLSFSAATGRFAVTPTGQGDAARLQLGTIVITPADPDADPPIPDDVLGYDGFGVLEFMGFNDIDWRADDGDPRMIRRAQNAVIYHDINSPLNLPGEIGIRMESAGNDFELEGIRVNVSNAGAYQIFNINATQNTDELMEMISEFIESYNELIRYINSLHTTQRPTQRGNRSFFEPLTDEQRNAMSEREVEQWEERARMGLFHRDPMIRNLHSELRRMMFEPVTLGDGTRLALFNIGITTVGMDAAREDRMMGILAIDEDRLREALETNLSGVQALFSRSNTQADVPVNTAAERNAAAPHLGVAWRLRNTIENAVITHNGPFRQRAGAISGDDGQSLMARQLRDYDQRIDRMQSWLIRRENHFFAMFARMEQAMAQSQAQMESLWAFAGM